MNPAIHIENLSFSYGEKAVIGNASVEIKSGTLTFILGRNGCGKSTFMKLVAGILPLQKGTIRILGNEYSASDFRKRSRVAGYLGQQSRSVFPFSVSDIILAGRAGYVTFTPGIDDYAHVDRALEETGIRHLKDRLVTELSGGEQQLVRLARVLAQDTPLLLLDEPITHLDIAHQSRIMMMLRQCVAAGKTVVAVLHDPTLALLFGDEFIFFRDGSLRKVESRSILADVGFLESVYGCELQIIPAGDAAAVIPKVR